MGKRSKVGAGAPKRRLLGLSVAVWTAFLLPIVVGLVVAVLYSVLRERSSTARMRSLARADLRTNLVLIHNKLEQIRAAAHSAVMPDAAEAFVRLPQRVKSTNLDTSFCSAFDGAAMSVSGEFAQAAEAYCDAVRGFAGFEGGIWDIWADNVGSRERLASILEAQVALACLLSEYERQYVWHFTMLYRIGLAMGMSEANLLKPLPGMPDLVGVTRLRQPEPTLARWVEGKFGVPCPP